MYLPRQEKAGGITDSVEFSTIWPKREGKLSGMHTALDYCTLPPLPTAIRGPQMASVVPKGTILSGYDVLS